MKTHPKYRISQWLDTSPESLAKPEADIFFGVQTQVIRRGPWLNVMIGGQKQLFKTYEEAEACILKLKAREKSKAAAA